jgi:hypothetical protein
MTVEETQAARLMRLIWNQTKNVDRQQANERHSNLKPRFPLVMESKHETITTKKILLNISFLKLISITKLMSLI